MEKHIDYLKNPFDLLFAYAKAKLPRAYRQKEFSEQLRKASRKIKSRVTGQSGSKRVGYSKAQISQWLKVDYFDRHEKHLRPHENLLRREDEFVLNSLLETVSRGAFKDIINDRAAIEAEIKYQFPRGIDEQKSETVRKLANFRGIWQFLHVSLRKADMDGIRYGDEPDQQRYKIREGVVIFFGFNSDKMKTLLLGSGRPWVGEAWIRRSDLLYVQLNVPRGNEEGYLVFHAPNWLSDPTDWHSERVIHGRRLGTVSDGEYKGNAPIVSARCVLRRLNYASRHFLAADNLVDDSVIDFYGSLCDYRTLGDIQAASLTSAQFVALPENEKFMGERHLNLNSYLKNLVCLHEGSLEFPMMQFPHGGRSFDASRDRA